MLGWKVNQVRASGVLFSPWGRVDDQEESLTADSNTLLQRSNWVFVADRALLKEAFQIESRGISLMRRGCLGEGPTHPKALSGYA